MAEFQTFDGIRLTYEVHGEGDPVVLLHGFASNSFINWERPGIIGALTAAGYSAIALDARGHGNSDKPHDAESYGGAHVKDVRALLDELSIESCKVAGYSMGGRVLLGLLLVEPRIKAAVIGGVGGGVLKPSIDRNQIAEALVAEDPSQFSQSAQAFRSFADATKADREALAAAMRAGMSQADPAVLKEIRTPVVIICGDRDTLVGDPAELADALGNATTVAVEGDHLGAVNDPLFVKSMIEFLDAN